jgi:hypothetical protein
MAAHQATHAKPRPARTKSTRSKTIVRKVNTGEFKVALKTDAIKAFRIVHRAKVKALMETLSDGIDASRRSGRSTSFLVTVDAEGQPSIKATETPILASDSPTDDDLETALSAARERGRRRAADILTDVEMLSADAFADLLGVSKPTVHAKREKHELLALDGPKRGFRFPSWQLDENGKPFAAIPRLFEQLGDSAWTVYRFLTQRHSTLEGITGLEALRRGKTEAVVETAEGVARGTFA